MEKSDSVEVAVKSTNKGTRVPAEPMEPRTEPKGNPGGQSARRTQCRESASQAADRIRHFVRRGPRERLTALLTRERTERRHRPMAAHDRSASRPKVVAETILTPIRRSCWGSATHGRTNELPSVLARATQGKSRMP